MLCQQREGEEAWGTATPPLHPFRHRHIACTFGTCTLCDADGGTLQEGAEAAAKQATAKQANAKSDQPLTLSAPLWHSRHVQGRRDSQ